ncbi:MAG: hypothetical protein KY475_05565 [Planctomycetes bacterium]|nr:hypothetical protein [Planctomycetota bacterium]
MIDAFAQELVTLAAADPRVVLLVGDMDVHLFEGFRSRFPDRFYDCGAAEASMMGVAAGLSLSGLRPVACSSPFVAMRCLDQIRTEICDHWAPVVIAGLGAAPASCDGAAVLPMLQEISIIAPGDAAEARLALRTALSQDGPTYLRVEDTFEPPPDLASGANPA